MSNAWLCMPSKRPPAEAQPVVDRWVGMGYAVLVQRDPTDPFLAGCLNIARPYSGYPEAANHLILRAMELDEKAEWFVCAGDDITPDPYRRADEIAQECGIYFAKLNETSHPQPQTFGVMQPTGDRWGEGERGTGKEHEAHIDCIAGSPWIGREFARRMYGGKGPYWPEYYHMFDDEEIMCVAQLMGVFWQRRDITHHHNWCKREPGGKEPAFLQKAYGRENWNKSKALFNARKAANFPGHEPIP